MRGVTAAHSTHGNCAQGLPRGVWDKFTWHRSQGRAGAVPGGVWVGSQRPEVLALPRDGHCVSITWQGWGSQPAQLPHRLIHVSLITRAKLGCTS